MNLRLVFQDAFGRNIPMLCGFSPMKWFLVFAVVVLSSSFSDKAQAVDQPLSLSTIANSSYVGILPGLPSGTTVLGGVTFDLPGTRPDWQSNPNSQAPDLYATFGLAIDNAAAVHLLLNTGNTYTSQMQIGDQIGVIALLFLTGPTEIVPLRVGHNIREQAVGTTAQPVINTFTDSNLQEVWRGNNNGGVESVVDMLTIPLSGTRTLTQIQIVDQSQAKIGQVNPVLALKAVTVQTIPEPRSLVLSACGLLLVFRRVMRRVVRNVVVATLAIASCPLNSSAAVSFSENFSNSTVTPLLVAPSEFFFGPNATPVGTAQNSSGTRRYITTSQADFNLVDFVFEITFTVNSPTPAQTAFIGFGSGEGDPNFFTEPHTSIYLRQFPDDFENGQLRLTISSAPQSPPNQPPETVISGATGPGNGTHRARIQKVGDIVTLGVDEDYGGGPFIADYSAVRSMTTDLAFLNGTNSRLFFGVQSGNTTFDNLTVAVVPEPASTALCGCGVLLLARRSRISRKDRGYPKPPK